MFDGISATLLLLGMNVAALAGVPSNAAARTNTTAEITARPMIAARGCRPDVGRSQGGVAAALARMAKPALVRTAELPRELITLSPPFGTAEHPARAPRTD